MACCGLLRVVRACIAGGPVGNLSHRSKSHHYYPIPIFYREKYLIPHDLPFTVRTFLTISKMDTPTLKAYQLIRCLFNFSLRENRGHLGLASGRRLKAIFFSSLLENFISIACVVCSSATAYQCNKPKKAVKPKIAHRMKKRFRRSRSL